MFSTMETRVRPHQAHFYAVPPRPAFPAALLMIGADLLQCPPFGHWIRPKPYHSRLPQCEFHAYLGRLIADVGNGNGNVVIT